MKQARITLITLAGVVAASLMTSSAIAGERVDWSVTVGSGGYPPPVVYSAPPRIVYAPPPPVVYYTPAPVVHYGGYYGPPRHAYGHRWHGHPPRHHHGGHRHHGHDRHDRHDHGRHGHHRH